MEIKKNSYYLIRVLLQILIVYIVYTLCRIVFGLYNYETLSIKDFSNLLNIFWGGLRFDASAISLVNLSWLILMLLPVPFLRNKYYESLTTAVYFLANIPAFILNLGDVIYFQFTGRRTVLTVFKEFENDGEWEEIPLIKRDTA